LRLTRDGHPVLMMNLGLDTKLQFAAQNQSRGPSPVAEHAMQHLK
jgi:hypothetical protein